MKKNSACTPEALLSPPRISVQRCRELLGKECKLTDQEVESLRDDLYGFADIAITIFLEKKKKEKIQTQAEKSPSTEI